MSGDLGQAWDLDTQGTEDLFQTTWIAFKIFYIVQNFLSLRHWNTGWCPAGLVSPRREKMSLALVGRPSSDGDTIRIPLVVDDLLHRPVFCPIFSYWVGWNRIWIIRLDEFDLKYMNASSIFVINVDVYPFLAFSDLTVTLRIQE